MTTPFELTPRQKEANRLLGGRQRHTLIYGGSRSGKTFLFVRAVLVRALKAEGSRHLIARQHQNAVRSSIGLDTLPTVVQLCWPGLWERTKEHRQDGYFQLPNGSEVWLGGLDDKDRVDKVLGREYATIYLNEASQISYHATMTVLTRLAQTVPGLAQRAYYDLNPGGTAHWTHRLFVEGKEPRSMEAVTDPDNYQYTVMNPADNAANLDPEYIEELRRLPAKQRKRFFSGEYVSDVEGALWTLDAIEAGRVTEAPAMRRIVVAVDPSGADGPEDERSDEIGISVCGLGRDGHGYVLADRTLRASPAGWARAAVNAYHEYSADKILGERNYGGAMVESTIKSADKRAPVTLVTASRGKHIRAEPVAGLYEETPDRGSQVHHVGRFPELEDEMGNFSVHGYQGDRSPNRADALVFALTELMLGETRTVKSKPVTGLI